MEQNFSFRRIGILIRHDFMIEWRTYALLGGLTALLYFLLTLEDYLEGALDPSPYPSMFGYALFIWGLFLTTSHAFRPLHKSTSRESYLLMPASALEKMLARLIPLTVGLAISLILFIFLISCFIEMVLFTLSGIWRPPFNPFDISVAEMVATYILIQAPFFLGGVWFRKLSLLTTAIILIPILSLLLASALGGGYAAIRYLNLGPWAAQSLHGYGGDLGNFYFDQWWNSDFNITDHINFDYVIWAFQAILIALPPALWWIAWLRLKEAQAPHGV